MAHELVPHLEGLRKGGEGRELVQGQHCVSVNHETEVDLGEVFVVFRETRKVGIGEVDVHFQALEE